MDDLNIYGEDAESSESLPHGAKPLSVARLLFFFLSLFPRRPLSRKEAKELRLYRQENSN